MHPTRAFFTHRGGGQNGKGGTPCWQAGRHSTCPSRTPGGWGVEPKRHPPTHQPPKPTVCGIFHTLYVLRGLQVFPHGIGIVRNVHATFTQNFHVELSQAAKWLQSKMGAEAQHSGNLLLGPKGSLPTMDPPPPGGGVPSEGGTHNFETPPPGGGEGVRGTKTRPTPHPTPALGMPVSCTPTASVRPFMALQPAHMATTTTFHPPVTPVATAV